MVAATAAVISFSHVQNLARAAGEPELTAWLLPLSIDGAIAAAAAVVLADSRADRRPTVLTWLMLGLGLTASLAANIASAEPSWIARCVAAWPPIALALGIEVLASMARRAHADSPARREAGAGARSVARTGPAGPTDAAPGAPTREQAARPASEPRPTAPAPTAPAPSAKASGTGPARTHRPDQAVPADQGDRDALHLVRSGPEPAGEDVTEADRAAIALIRRLDAESPSGPVSRRSIQAELGCGASRAARLAGLARSESGADGGVGAAVRSA